MNVWALDVGQGSATLIEFPCGAVLVDTGGEHNDKFDGAKALLSQLEGFFARRPDLKRTLDLLVITHPHIDHLRGAPGLLERFKVKNIVDNGHDGDDLVREPLDAIRSYVRKNKKNVGYRAVTVDKVKKRGWTDDVIDPLVCAEHDPDIRVLFGHMGYDPGWGKDFYGHRRFENQNNHSVVVKVTWGESSLLITGDLEEIAIEELVERTDGTDVLDADIFVVGHHGSHNGTTRELLEEVTPEVALISMGPASREVDWSAWRYGHPRAGVVKLLANMVRGKRAPVTVPVARYGRKFDPYRIDRAIYGTGWDGQIVVETSAKGGWRIRGAGSRSSLLSSPR